MRESADFLRSLQHNNSARPKFAIGQGTNAMLSISFQGTETTVPMAEILAFARRWETDRKAGDIEMQRVGNLVKTTYPLFSVRVDDPDVAGIRWD